MGPHQKRRQDARSISSLLKSGTRVWRRSARTAASRWSRAMREGSDPYRVHSSRPASVTARSPRRRLAAGFGTRRAPALELRGEPCASRARMRPRRCRQASRRSGFSRPGTLAMSLKQATPAFLSMSIRIAQSAGTELSTTPLTSSGMRCRDRMQAISAWRRSPRKLAEARLRPLPSRWRARDTLALSQRGNRRVRSLASAGQRTARSGRADPSIDFAEGSGARRAAWIE